MGFLERCIMRLFSCIMLFISCFTILIIFNIINIDWMESGFQFIRNDIALTKIFVLANGVLFLMAIRGLSARLKPIDMAKNGIVLENGNGKLVISKESLENLISTVSKDIPGTESISSRTVLDKNRNLRVQVNIVANQDVYLKDLSLEIQKRVKDALLKTADLEAKEVDVRIKNISNKKMKKSDDKKESKKNNKQELIEMPEKIETENDKEQKLLEDKKEKSSESKKEEVKK